MMELQILDVLGNCIILVVEVILVVFEVLVIKVVGFMFFFLIQL